MRNQTILTIAAAVIDSMIFQFEARYRRRVAVCSMGEHRTDSRIELLHRATIYSRKLGETIKRIAMDGLRPLIVIYGPGVAPQAEIERYASLLSAAGGECCGLLQLVRIQRGISASGWIKDHGMNMPIDVLSLPGSEMLKMSVGLMWPLSKTQVKRESGNTTTHGDNPDGEDWMDDFSRVIAFVGEGNMDRGREIVRKIAESDIAVVGHGRMGNCVEEHLVKLGAGKRAKLFNIDMDLTEMHNLDAVMWPEKAVGLPKAIVGACMLRAMDPGLNVYPIVEPVSGTNAARAVVDSEYIFSCVDNVPARAATAILARQFNRVHFDLTGGAAYTDRRDSASGGECRIGLPGSPGCPLCLSGIGWREALRQLMEADGQHLGNPDDWLDQRPGSSKIVISSVVSESMMLFLRLLQGRLRSSVWLHLNFNGLVAEWHDWTGRADSRTCYGCSGSGIGGLGDWNLEKWLRKTE